MSQMWTQLLRELSPDLVGMLTLEKVMASRSGDRLTVCLNASRLLTGTEFRGVESQLRAGFPGAQVKLNVNYPALREAAQADVTTVSKFISGLVTQKIPGAKPYLHLGESLWKLKNEKLVVPVVDEMGEKYLTKQGADKLIEQLLQTLFSLPVHVLIEIKGDTEKRIQIIEEKRQEEQRRMAEDAMRLAAQAAAKEKPVSKQVLGKAITEPDIEISQLSEAITKAVVRGEVISMDTRDLKEGATKLVTFSVTDYTGTVTCKMFVSGKRGQENSAETQKMYDQLCEVLKVGAWVRVRGNYRYDEYTHEMTLHATDMMKAKSPSVREDTADEKRVELHMHTQMSAMDACASASDLIKRAAKWGHKAVAITDHGVVQAFPDAFATAKKHKIKLIPGCEGYLIDDRAMVVKQADRRKIDGATFVVLDVETTGLNPRTDTIIELGAVRIENGKEVAEFTQLIRPNRPIPTRVTEITGITDAMVCDMPTLDEVIGDFHAFCEGSVICAHNADFDWAFVGKAFDQFELSHDHPVLDTLTLSRNLLTGQKSHKLASICKTLGVTLTKAHRAVHDARATGQALMIMLSRMESLETLNDLNHAFDGRTGSSRHIILLAATQEGLTNLYRLVSEAHLNHFYRTARIPRSLIEKHRKGLIVGSACEAGELFQAVLEGKGEAELKRIASFYDYLEIQPTGNNEFLVREGKVPDEKALQEMNKKIVMLGEALGKPVVATGDVHFMEPRDKVYRAILMTAKGFEDAAHQPPLYFRTTDDMLEEFAYLGEETARRVVIDAPNEIAGRVEDMTIFVPHPEGKDTFQPYWDYAEKDIRDLTEEKCKAIYGDPVPDIVRKRIEKELGSIIGYGFSTLYDIAVKLVAKSMSDGYVVGSRGSVGSSFVAWATGITEVNAMEPHYVCPNCKHSEFDVPKEYACGLDLPEKDCPVCATNMSRDGFNIPFEVFLGFKGDKVPDIDLNFSGEYQARAHAYVKELFGSENVFRAGTIGTIADKTAFGYVLNYMETHNLSATNAEKERLASGCTGVKRTTGQHPAGMVVLPKDYEIYQFTPIQHPADDLQTDIITTHFDFGSMHDVLVKLDILGHEDPTMLKKLQDLTGIAPQQVPLWDRTVFGRILSLFQSPDTLGVTAEQISVPTGTLGIPEFGTRFVRQMLVDTRPSTMEELIRISGLSHGTDVWVGNAQDIIKSGTAPLRQCVCTRDDIMNQLIALGVDSKMAFDIMESVRKGKGLKPNMEQAMIDANTPGWFIECCKKIKYMFPKAHAVAYVMMALRIAYFKIYYPIEYYACYLRRNLENFDALTMVADLPVIRAQLSAMNALSRDEMSKKDEDAITMLEILIEMLERGITLRPISTYESSLQDFRVLPGNCILPPLTALPGLGATAAETLVRAREEGPFISQEDMVRRKVQKSVVDLLRLAGALGDLPETSQVSLFDL